MGYRVGRREGCRGGFVGDPLPASCRTGTKQEFSIGSFDRGLFCTFRRFAPRGIRADRSSTGIRYALGSADPIKDGLPYTGPLTLYRSDTVSAVAIDEEGRPGFVVSARYSRIDPKLKVSLTYPYNRQYHAGGPLALVDGIEGDGAWRKGHWHGYQGNPFEAVLELPKATVVDSIDAGFLQDVRSWIVLPARVGFWAKNPPPMIGCSWAKPLINRVLPTWKSFVNPWAFVALLQALGPISK